MTLPLMILAALSMVAGFVPFSEWITSDGAPLETEFHAIIAIPSILVAVVGIAVAALLYARKNNRPDAIASGLSGLYTASFRKFYIDEVYLFVTHKVLFGLVSRPVAWFDRHVVDGTMNFIGNTTVYCSGAIKKLQSGHVQGYIWFFATGVLLLTFLILSLTL